MDPVTEEDQQEVSRMLAGLEKRRFKMTREERKRFKEEVDHAVEEARRAFRPRPPPWRRRY